MNFGVGLPNVGEFADPALLVELAVAAEGAGWDGFFLWDHLLYDDPRAGAVEPWSVIAAVAAVTHRIRIGVLVTAVPRRQPALLAQQVATIDLLSRGRCVFGAGLGSRADEYERFGQDPSLVERGRRLDEALAVIESLWSRESFDTTESSSPRMTSNCSRNRCKNRVRRFGLPVAGRTRRPFSARPDSTASCRLTSTTDMTPS